MELKPAFILILDISGYTRFIRLHRLSLIHAEQLITELMDSMISAAEAPLVLNKLQGDAALLYAVSDGSRTAARSLLGQVARVFDAFRRRERELLSECGLCRCDACAQVGRLRLKAFLHHGEVAFKQVLGFQEIAGENVILIHRLMKNSVPDDEYLLLTEAFHEIGGGPDGLKHRQESEACDGFGTVPIHVYASGSRDEPAPKPGPLLDRLLMAVKLDGRTLLRLFRKPTRDFGNLTRSQQDGPSPPA